MGSEVLERLRTEIIFHRKFRFFDATISRITRGCLSTILTVFAPQAWREGIPHIECNGDKGDDPCKNDKQKTIVPAYDKLHLVVAQSLVHE